MSGVDVALDDPADAVVGREAELAVTDGFLTQIADGHSALLLEGEAGIGKTTLWRATLHRAQRCGYRVLACSPGQHEVTLAFSGLADMLEDAVGDVLERLPPPQRRALEVALLLAEPAAPSDDGRAAAVATLTALRWLSVSQPLVVAVDDIQWLDAASFQVLEYAARRLGDEPVAIVVARRATREGATDIALRTALSRGRLTQLVVGPLGLNELGDLLDRHFGSALPHATLIEIHRTSAGNPFFALELARALAQTSPAPGSGAPLALPPTLEALLDDRMRKLPADVLDVLGVVAAAARPTVGLVKAIVDGHASDLLAQAEAASLVEIDCTGIRFRHPLLASAVYAAIPGPRMLDVHVRLATAVSGEEERARHLALATDEPDERVAVELERAAATARARGAPAVAADLLEQARRVTPTERLSEHWRRTIEAAECCSEGGDVSRTRRLAQAAVAGAPPGDLRARALRALALASYRDEGIDAAVVLLETALVEGRSERTRAQIELSLTDDLMQSSALARAARHATSAVALTERLDDPKLLAHALVDVALLDLLLGHGTRRDLLSRIDGLLGETAASEDWIWVRLLRACVLKWSDDSEDAISELRALRRWENEHGRRTPSTLFQLAQGEFWLGNWDAAAECAQDAHRAGRETGTEHVAALGLSLDALIDAHRGRIATARAAAEQAIALTEQGANARFTIRCHAVLGFLALSCGDASEAAGHLARAAELAVSLGYRDPNVLRHQADEIEALVGVGRLDDAEERTRNFEEFAARHDRVWSLATSARCRGLVLAAQGDAPGALAALERAFQHHERLAQPFEFGRTLLAYGSVLRRAKRKRAARQALEQALEVFDRLGAPLWAEKARSELGRIGGRAPAPRELTPTERSVVDLVISGCTNREVADRLYMSVKTVERHLTHVYAKLNVSSRRDLARRSGAGDTV